VDFESIFSIHKLVKYPRTIPFALTWRKILETKLNIKAEERVGG
jgi:hypothetical protein